jgi:hypothetical protein
MKRMNMSNSYPSVPPTEPVTPTAFPATGFPTTGAASSDTTTPDGPFSGTTGKHTDTSATATDTSGSDAGDSDTSVADKAKDAAATAKETADRAKDEAANLAGGAKDAASKVAGTAKEEATKVAGEAKAQAADLYKQTSAQLKEQAGVQQKRVATGLQSLSDELTAMADKSENGGVATDLVQQVAGRAGSVATWLDDRDPGTLLSDVKDFAARRPGTFIGIAAVAGILAGRLTRSLAASAKDEKEAEETSTSDSTTPAATTSPLAGTPVATVTTPVEPALYPETPVDPEAPRFPATAPTTDPVTGERLL